MTSVTNVAFFRWQSLFNKINVKIALIIGDEEFKKNKISYKNLESGSQLTLTEKELFEKIKNE